MTRVRESTELDLEQHRVELTGYCYRMLGSASEAEDAVQETMVRAWRATEKFEGRSSVRSWLYRIATNACFDMLSSSQRRARPIDLTGTPTTDLTLGPLMPETTWLQPIPDTSVLPERTDPAEVAVSRESIRLAFVAALQNLPPRQRAVLILREVLCWRAAEVATLLDTTTASVNSALQRARATLAELDPAAADPFEPDDPHQRELLDRYVELFEAYDIESLVRLLHEDAISSMPPYLMWLSGPAEIARWMLGPGHECRGSTLVPTSANGLPAFGHYRPGGVPWSLHVLEISDGKIHAMNNFLDTAALFPLFGLPMRLER
jgi:RNA polymerase sigma-70 factor (ECF subfamily)